MTLARIGVAWTLFVIGFVSQSEATDSPFEIIPSPASLVIRLRSPATSIDKLADYLKKLQPGRGESNSFLAKGSWADETRNDVTSVLKQLADNADLEQDWWDLEQDWWIYCSDLFAEKSEYVFLIPAKDPVSLKASLTKEEDREIDEHSFYVHKSWVVLGLNTDIELSKKCSAGKQPSIEGRLSTDAMAVFEHGDLSVFVDIRQLISLNVMTVGAILGFARAGYSAWIEAIQPEQAGRALSGVINQFVDSLTQGIWDADSIVVAARIDADDIAIEQYLGVAADSPTAAFFGANPGSEMKTLSSLPALSTLYLGYHGDQKALTSWTTKVLKMFSAGQDSGWSRVHRDTRREYEKLNYGTLAIAFPMRSRDQGLLRSISVWEVDDPQHARELDRKWHELVSAATKETDAAAMRLSPDAEQFGDYQVDVVTEPNVIDFGELIFGIGNFQKAFEKSLYGPDGNSVRTIYMKDRIVSSHGGVKARVAGAIRRMTDSLNGVAVSEPYFQHTRDKLPQKANLIVMIDAGGLAALSLHFWNGYMDIIQAVADANGMQIKVAAFADAEADEPQMDEDEKAVVPAAVAPVAAAAPVAAVATAPAESRADDEVVDAKRPPAAPIVAEVPPKFSDEDIDSMYGDPSLLGFSLSLEPQGCRGKIVIPLSAAKNLIKAVDFAVKRLGITEVAPDVDEDDQEEDDEE